MPARSRRFVIGANAYVIAAKSHPSPEEHSFPSALQWLEFSRNCGCLVAELYQRPNWRELVAHKNTPELRKQLLPLSPCEVAETLVTLGSM